jgi:hypothetical protein
MYHLNTNMMPHTMHDEKYAMIDDLAASVKRRMLQLSWCWLRWCSSSFCFVGHLAGPAPRMLSI